MLKRYLCVLLAASLLCSGSVWAVPAVGMKYYYQSQDISVIDDGRYLVSTLLVGKNRIIQMDLGTKHTSHYMLGDGKSQNLVVGKNQSLSDTNQAQSIDFQAYGDSGQMPSNIQALDFNYNGEYKDPSTGMAYLRARDYQSDTQRFMTMDSYSVWNKYNFASADPVNHSDPTGHDSEQEKLSPIQEFSLIAPFLGVSASSWTGIRLFSSFGSFGSSFSWGNAIMNTSGIASLFVSIMPWAGTAIDNTSPTDSTTTLVENSVGSGMAIASMGYFGWQKYRAYQANRAAYQAQDDAIESRRREILSDPRQLTLSDLEEKNASKDIIDFEDFRRSSLGVAHVGEGSGKAWHATRQDNLETWFERQAAQKSELTCPSCRGKFSEGEWFAFKVVESVEEVV